MNDLLGYITRYRWRSLTIGFLLLMLYVVVSVVIPRSRESFSVYRSWQGQKEQTSEKNSLEMRQVQLRIASKKIQDSLEELYVQIPYGTDWTYVLDEFRLYLEQNNLTLEKFRVHELVTEEKYQILPLTLTVSGRFQEVGRYINQLELSKQVISVQMLTIDVPNWTQSNQLLAELTLHIVMRERSSDSEETTSQD